MKRNLFTNILILFVVILFLLQVSCFAVIDQAKLFISTECNSHSSSSDTMKYALNTFSKLGYDIQRTSSLSGYQVTNSKAKVLDYIKGTGNNYALFVFAHGNTGIFTMNSSDVNQEIIPSNITGYWHFVFLNSCSCLSDDQFAQAFKTVGYNYRAILGWYKAVEFNASREWWSYFKNVAGTTNIRSACLAAADQCSYSTPIRIYGDKTWDGMAWDK